VPVLAATAVAKDIPVQLEAIGSVEAINTVSIRARVGGELMAVHFREGQEVARGNRLFSLDPRPFQAALDQAQATLARDRARQVSAEADARRYGELVEKDYVTRQQYDQVVADAAAMQATVEADEAAVRNARLDLDYATIRAPIAGRTGSLLVQQGNLIKANADNPMLVIHQLSPIYVSFAVPAQNLPEILRRSAAQPLSVSAWTPDGQDTPVAGSLTFIDNQVDEATATIRLKATFDNRDRRLWPGQFVRVRLELAMRHGAVVIPAQAVQTGQQGDVVFTIGHDLSAEVRPVVVGLHLDGDVVIEKGIQAGERVVTDGQLRLAAGAKVEIKEQLRPAETDAR